MRQLTYKFGDKYEVIKSSSKKRNTNIFTVLSSFIVLLSFWLQRFLEKKLDADSNIPLIVFISLWIMAFIIPFYLFNKKLVRYRELDLYLLLFIIFLIVAFAVIGITGF